MPKITKKISQSALLNAATLIYVVMIIAANVMAMKVVDFLGIKIDAGTITYPVTFLMGDIVAELFGFKPARKMILIGFAANLAFAVFTYLGTFLPAADTADALAEGYDALFTYSFRILAASFIAYLAGSLLNAASMIWIRKATGDKWLAFRTIGSTALGAAADTAIFTVIAWIFVLPMHDMLILALCSYAVKMVYEILIATPIDYLLVRLIKKHVEPDVKAVNPEAVKKSEA
ncbi:MAG: queuosine precursor transporter [Clostridiales bacterium]|jgi:uncharacterized integral membrane protein (TIGR00697 family)|nr:queuosine precursor transporter [Clostridiales bacterium]